VKREAIKEVRKGIRQARREIERRVGVGKDHHGKGEQKKKGQAKQYISLRAPQEGARLSFVSNR
jgi:hypothetical protein